MNFIVVMPLARDNNPPKCLINHKQVQFNTLQINFLKEKNSDKINISKEAKKWSILHF